MDMHRNEEMLWILEHFGLFNCTYTHSHVSCHLHPDAILAQKNELVIAGRHSAVYLDGASGAGP